MAAEVTPQVVSPIVVEKLLDQVKALRERQTAVCAASKGGCRTQGSDEFVAIFATTAAGEQPRLLNEIPFDTGPFLKWAREEGSNVFALKVRVVEGLNSADAAMDLQAMRPVFAVEPQLSHSLSNLLYFINKAFEKGWQAQSLQEWANPHTVAELVLQSPFASAQEEADAVTNEGRLEVLKHAVDPTVGTDEKDAARNIMLESSEIEAKLDETSATDRRKRAAEKVAQMTLEAAPAEGGMGIKFNGCHFSGVRRSQGSQDRISLVLEQWVLPPEVVEHFPLLLLLSRGGRVYTESHAALEAFGGRDFVLCVHDPSKVPQITTVLSDIQQAGERLRYAERIELCSVAFGLKDSKVS